MLIMAYWCSGR